MTGPMAESVCGLKVSKGVPRYVEAAVDCVDEEGRLDGTMYYDNPPIQPGDLLLTADGVAVTSLPLPELVKILRGPHHSVLEMTLSNSEHQTYTVRLLRHKPHEFDHQLIGAEPAPLAPYVPAHAAGAPSPQTAQVAPQLQATASGVQAPVVEDGARHSSLYTKQMPTSGTEQVQKQEHVSPPPQQEDGNSQSFCGLKVTASSPYCVISAIDVVDEDGNTQASPKYKNENIYPGDM